MTTELGFLLDLLLNHKLPKPTKDLVAGRIREVETMLSTTQVRIPAGSGITPAMISNQAPSTQAIMARNPDLIPPPPVPIEAVAQTQATAAALAARQQSIAQAMSGKPVPGETKPRKF